MLISLLLGNGAPKIQHHSRIRQEQQRQQQQHHHLIIMVITIFRVFRYGLGLPRILTGVAASDQFGRRWIRIIMHNEMHVNKSFLWLS